MSKPEREDQVAIMQRMLKVELAERGFSNMVGVAVGAASTCWDSVSSAGVFHSSEAAAIADAIVAAHDKLVQQAYKDGHAVASKKFTAPKIASVDAHSAASGLFDPTKEEDDER